MQIEGLKKKFGSQEEFAKALGQMNLSEQAVRDSLPRDGSAQADRPGSRRQIVLDPGEAKGFYDQNPEIFKSRKWCVRATSW